MPAKLQTELQIPSDSIPNYDEVVVTSIITPVHFSTRRDGDGAALADGNIEIGDTLLVDGDGNYEKSEKHVTHYLLLLAGVVVYRGHVELTGAELVTAMGRNPNARNEIKNAAYDILSDKAIVPNNATVS